MLQRFPSLNALRAFNAAARCESITAAADLLSVSPGAVSRQVKLLEEYFNAQFFVRTQRGLELTEKGRVLHEAVSSAFDQLEAASNKLLGGYGSATLRIGAYSTFVSDWLLARLGKFQTNHPDIKVSVHASLASVDIRSHDFDVVISASSDIADGQYHELLYSSQYFPACSPSYLDLRGPISVPEDIVGHTLLYSNKQIRNWKKWLDHAGILGVSLKDEMSFENSSNAYKAAREGMGIVMAHHIYVADDLKYSRLVNIFNTRLQSNHEHYFRCDKHRRQDSEIKAFREWLMSEISITEKETDKI